MNVAATLRGTLAGAFVAALLALAVALLVYHTTTPPATVRWVLRALGLAVSFTAGWTAGRTAPGGAVLQGALAALAVTVLGNLAASWGGWPVGALWSSLLTAAVLGAAGGLTAALC